MQRNTLWLIFALVCMYLALVYCEEQQPAETNLEDINKSLLENSSTDLQEEARTRRRHRHRHHLYQTWGWHALAIAYLVKIKLVVVAFFVGSAVYFAFRYWWPHQKCNTEIILDHPPPSFAHHDHIPYSLDHTHEHYSEHPHFDSSSFGSSSPGSSFEPYSAYSGSYGGSDIVSDISSTETHTFRKKREVEAEVDSQEDASQEVDSQEDDSQEDVSEEEVEGRQMPVANEEQIGNFMFMFLGLDSKPCRRRFICEMEFRSKVNPLTAMAFRVIGRSFFGKYTNDRNELGKAYSYDDCASVNSECVFIENENPTEEEEAAPENETNETTNTEVESATEDLKVEPPVDESNAIESNNIEERANYRNLLAERRNALRRRVRGDRYLKQQ